MDNAKDTADVKMQSFIKALRKAASNALTPIPATQKQP
jgi:hypothetical protein